MGFTNITDHSARFVFTTAEPVKARVKVSGGGTRAWMLSHDSLDQIHAFQITGLQRDREYQIQVMGTTADGRRLQAAAPLLRPKLRPASTHRWPGVTIFGAGVSRDAFGDLDALAGSGIGMVRIEAPWFDLFPQGRQVDQKVLDTFLHRIDELKKRQIEPLVVLDYCVPWAKRYTDKTMTWRNASFGPPDRLEDWEFYLRSIITALDGSVKYFEIWNEPDAGYLATGSYVERPGLPPPIGRPPFKDNWAYWLGDRYVPMIMRARQVLAELRPDAIIMNGGWNRDYGGARGDLLFERGASPYFDTYAFHTYCGGPLSFSKWHESIDGQFRTNIDRIFAKHGVSMPLAVTEWGWPAWDKPNPKKGFVTFSDAQIFLIKSSFYFLSMERMELLIQFELGIGPQAREKDPSFFMLVSRDAEHKLVFHPTFNTFRWLASTFSRQRYRALSVQVTPGTQVKAYAIQLLDTKQTFVAVWQDGVLAQDGSLTAAPPREVELRIAGVADGTYRLQNLDREGKGGPAVNRVVRDGLDQRMVLPAAPADSESEPCLFVLSPELSPN